MDWYRTAKADIVNINDLPDVDGYSSTGEDEDIEQARAAKYFSIGHGDFSEAQGRYPSFQLWVMIGGSIEKSKIFKVDQKTGDVEGGFGHRAIWGDQADDSYKGRYEPQSGLLTVAQPMNATSIEIPNVVMSRIMSAFPRAKKIILASSGKLIKTAMDEDDIYDAVRDAREQIISEFFRKGRKKGSMMSWSVIPISRLTKIWQDYAKYSVVRDEAGINEIADQMIRILGRIQAATELSGHTQQDPEEIMEEYGYKLTKKQSEDYYWNFLETPYGTPISDFGLNPLWKLAFQLDAANAEQKLVIIDQMLNVVHQRGDLAALFIEGGSGSLGQLSNGPETIETSEPVEKPEDKPVNAASKSWYKAAQETEVVEEPQTTSHRVDLTLITASQWEKICDRMCGLGYDFRDGNDTKRIYERLNNTAYGIQGDHKKVLDAVLGGKDYVKKYENRQIRDMFTKARKTFGLTNDLRECGYILPSGSMLDFSGKNRGGSAGRRALDHSEINQIISMNEFVAMGAIRHFPETPGVEMQNMPTEQQLNVIYRDVERSGNGYNIELIDPRQKSTYERYDAGVKPTKVIQDIINYYKGKKFSFNLSKILIAEV